MVARLRHALLFLSLIFASHPALAQEDYVDLELVLAVDVSRSMDAEEQRLQRDGYAAAFRHPEVVSAIASGPLGRIAVTYVEWAGPEIQTVLVPWTILAKPEDAFAFADNLIKMKTLKMLLFKIQLLLPKFLVEALDLFPGSCLIQSNPGKRCKIGKEL